jgi:hypothetical protein
MSVRRVVWIVGAVTVATVTAGAVVGFRHLFAPAVPVVQCESEIDLGERYFNDQVLARFRVANEGRADLVLSSFGTSCSCAGVVSETSGEWLRVEQVTVPAGGSVELAVRVSVIAAAGQPQTVQVLFSTTDPANPTHQLLLKIPRVRGNLYCDPAAVVFGTTSPDAVRPQVLRVYENGGGERKVGIVRSTSPDRFTVRQMPTPTGSAPHEIGGKLVCELQVTPVPGYAGSLNGMIEIQVSGDRAETKAIPVTGEVSAEFAVTPSAVALPRTANEQPVWWTELTVVGRDERPFQLELKNLPAGLKAQVEPTGEAGSFTVRVECEKQESKPASLRLIARRTGEPPRTLDVPVHISR